VESVSDGAVYARSLKFPPCFYPKFTDHKIALDEVALKAQSKFTSIPIPLRTLAIINLTDRAQLTQTKILLLNSQT
jgi:hypothetical protein